jgi:ATP-dependent RNA helicase SUPV3L1/SUV3
MVVVDVAVVDEIQMMRDPQRGWAWTRALLGKRNFFSWKFYSFRLGLQAKEIHLCGESSTIRLVQDLMITTGDEVEIREYKRLTKLSYQDRALGNLNSTRTN